MHSGYFPRGSTGSPRSRAAGPDCRADGGPKLTVRIDGASLDLDALVAVAAGRDPVVLAPEAARRMAQSRQSVEAAAARGDRVYGLTTGVAERKTVLIGAGEQESFNRRLIAGHRIAQGPLATQRLVRATLVCLVNGLATAYPGVRREVADRIIELLNGPGEARIRTLGSVGEADLGPMADVAEELLRGGLTLEAGEGLALLDNNAFSTAATALALADMRHVLEALEAAAALDFEGFAANPSPLEEVVTQSARHVGRARSRQLLAGLLDTSAIHLPGGHRNLQDPLSFRCVPQLHGVAWEAFFFARRVVEVELNSGQGNPLVSLATGRLVSSGNFDAGGLSAACDHCRIALAPAVAAAAERCVKLLQANWSGLSPGLALSPEEGDDGLAELAVTAQSLAVEARSLAHPVSFELVSTSKAEGIEDRTSMAPLSARRLSEMTALTARLVALELIVSAQAVDLRHGTEAVARLGRGTRRLYRLVRESIPFAPGGEQLPQDLDKLEAAVVEGVRVAWSAGG